MPDNNNQQYNIDNASHFITSIISGLQEELKFLTRKAIVLNNNIIEMTTEITAFEEKADKSASVFSPIVSESQKKYDETKEGLEKLKKEAADLEKNISLKMEEISQYMNVNYFLSEYKNNIKYTENIEETGIKILEILEFERSRIARDLHDSITQNLTNIMYRADLCTKLLDVDVIRVRLELISMTECIRSCINEMREIIYNLKPMALEDLGLSEAVRRFINTVRENRELQMTVSIMGDEPDNISSVLKVTLYRVIQEAVSNSLKHSKSDTIVVNMNFDTDFICVEIYDNGCGFDISEVSCKEDNTRKGHGLGLSTMQERIKLLAGNFELETKPGKGTKIKIKVPVTDNI